MSVNDEILTVNEACKLLKISRPTLMRLLSEGKLRGFKVGKRVRRIRRCDVEKYIEGDRS
jgi:DNA binding domain, excisionase family